MEPTLGIPIPAPMIICAGPMDMVVAQAPKKATFKITTAVMRTILVGHTPAELQFSGQMVPSACTHTSTPIRLDYPIVPSSKGSGRITAPGRKPRRINDGIVIHNHDYPSDISLGFLVYISLFSN